MVHSGDYNHGTGSTSFPVPQSEQNMKPSPGLQKSRKQKGFIAVTFAVMIVAMIGFAGLAVDAGYMQWNKRRVQMAADAAAMGALREMQRGHDTSAVSAAALNDS